MISKLENPQSEYGSKIYKVEREELPPPEDPKISFEEAVSWVAMHPKSREKLLPPELLEALAEGKDLKELLEGEFKELTLKGRRLAETNNFLEQAANGPTKKELIQAATSFLKFAYGLELDPKLFSEFKIIFLDGYRWAGFFLQRGQSTFAGSKAVVVPEEGLIIVKTDEYSSGTLKGLEGAPRDKATTGRLKTTLLHELLHTLSVINYWGKEEKEGEWVLAARRVGLTSMRLRKSKTKEDKPAYEYISSLHSLYEGVIEELTIAIALNKLNSAIPLGVIEEEAEKIYSGEIDVLRNLTVKVPLSYFVKAVFEKEALRELVKKVNAAYGPRYLEVIGELMKWEKGYGYPSTVKFIQGGKIKAPASIFKRVNPKFVTEHYPNIHLS